MSELVQKPKAAPLSAPPPKKSATPETVVSSVETMAELNQALGRVTVIHGAQEMPCDVAGKSIAYVREALGPVLQVPHDASVLVDRVKVKDESLLLTPNSVLEFIKADGVKGLTV